MNTLVRTTIAPTEAPPQESPTLPKIPDHPAAPPVERPNPFSVPDWARPGEEPRPKA